MWRLGRGVSVAGVPFFSAGAPRPGSYAEWRVSQPSATCESCVWLRFQPTEHTFAVGGQGPAPPPPKHIRQWHVERINHKSHSSVSSPAASSHMQLAHPPQALTSPGRRVWTQSQPSQTRGTTAACVRERRPIAGRRGGPFPTTNSRRALCDDKALGPAAAVAKAPEAGAGPESRAAERHVCAAPAVSPPCRPWPPCGLAAAGGCAAASRSPRLEHAPASFSHPPPPLPPQPAVSTLVLGTADGAPRTPERRRGHGTGRCVPSRGEAVHKGPMELVMDPGGRRRASVRPRGCCWQNLAASLGQSRLISESLG